MNEMNEMSSNFFAHVIRIKPISNKMNQKISYPDFINLFFLLKNYRATRIVIWHKVFVLGGNQNNYFSIESHLFITILKKLFRYFTEEKK